MRDEVVPTVPTAGGLSTGEGLIHHVRDPITKHVKNKKTGESELVVVDEGVEDKRLLVIETEFARTLTVKGRERNILSQVMREAWDRGDLQSMVKTNPYKATGAHIGLVAHITKEELLRYLDPVDISSGFVNRILWVAGKRSKVLPDDNAVPEGILDMLAAKLREALDFAQNHSGPLRRDAEAQALWRQVYPELTEGKTGLLGAATDRAAAQVLRLSVVYALLDQSLEIRLPHLKAALAVWDYCEQSARWLFGDQMADLEAETIYTALRTRGALSRSQIRDLFQGHLPSAQIAYKLATLRDAGLVEKQKVKTAGRSAEIWQAVGAKRREKREKSTTDDTLFALNALNALDTQKTKDTENDFSRRVTHRSISSTSELTPGSNPDNSAHLIVPRAKSAKSAKSPKPPANYDDLGAMAARSDPNVCGHCGAKGTIRPADYDKWGISYRCICGWERP